MSQIFLPDGSTYSSPTNKKVAAPATGNAFGAWAGRDTDFITLPGGGLVQFDLSKLTVQDFRTMRDHYQINSSLAVLSFMQHQVQWHIECDDAKIRDFATEQLQKNWTGLNRAMSTANWAGYSPAALEWDNEGSRIVLSKVKDLFPEECAVNWKEEEGWAPPGRVRPKFKTYDGIRQFGGSWPIPTENSLWYPLLMENGDYSGRKLLRPAFQSWYFSTIIHLFANRYFERFGEPVPIGRAPYDDTITVGGKEVPGNVHLLGVLEDLRNRAVVVLPNDRTENSKGGSDFDYDISYLESQMRGADFERYLTRLDEEMSIGMFTPILLLRTADVGSYNLGQGHLQVYQWMLNGMNDDRKVYIDKYLLSKMTDYNFGPNAPRPKIVFQKLGTTNADTVSNLIIAMIQGGKVKPDLQELGEIAGLTLTEVKEAAGTAEPADAPEEQDPATPEDDGDAPANARERIVVGHSRSTAKEVVNRVRPQVENAFKDGKFAPGFKISMGFKRRMAEAFATKGVANHVERAEGLYAEMDSWIETALEFHDEFDTAESFTSLFEAMLNKKIADILGASE